MTSYWCLSLKYANVNKYLKLCGKFSLSYQKYLKRTNMRLGIFLKPLIISWSLGNSNYVSHQKTSKSFAKWQMWLCSQTCQTKQLTTLKEQCFYSCYSKSWLDLRHWIKSWLNYSKGCSNAWRTTRSQFTLKSIFLVSSCLQCTTIQHSLYSI